ncbi:MAG: type IV secretion system protein [Rickettsiaceae bacterium]|nr:type IV secretion system protein [Rickettsiaceae bacterium]
MKSVSVTMFKNMTCYKNTNDADNCVNFFQYIRAMLILYISLYGLMFLMGSVQISQYDIVIRVIKVGIVSGLMNDKTYEFFNMYILDVVTSFSDEIMANMSGYSIYTGVDKISNPFMFLNELMTKIFLSTTFYAQILALLSMGLSGPFYFLIVFISIAIVVMVSFRAIAVYLMAFMGITVLISLAPLFLTFILFERTKHLFDSWVKFMVSYMLEPIILLAGIIILTQLFTIYLDYLIGYSVCWKCALPFSLPFPQIENVTPLFLNVPLFCLNWFAPWGIDYRSSVIGINMQHITVLLILAYCMWSYVEFSNMIVGKIAGGAAMASGTDASGGMSSVMGGSAMKAMGVQPGSFDSVMNDMKGRANQSVSRAGSVASNRVGSAVKGEKSSAYSKVASVASGSANVAAKGGGLFARGATSFAKGIGSSFANKAGTPDTEGSKGKSRTKKEGNAGGKHESGQQKGKKAPRNPSSKKGK